MELIRARMPRGWSEANARASALPHVLLVVDQFPKTLGGGERIVLKLAGLLPSYGYRVSILTFAIHAETAGLELPPCPIYLLPLERTYDARAFRAALAMRRFLRRERVEIVQTFFESSDLWAGLVTKMTSRAKLIWSRRDMGILRLPKHAKAYRWMAGMPDAVFAVSEQVRRHAMEVDGIRPERVHTVYNGMELSGGNGMELSGGNGMELSGGNGRGERRDAGSMVVTTVGNIRRVKGHDVFLGAAARVRAGFPGARFRIAGAVLEPEYFTELEALVAELGLGGCVEFVGGVTDLEGHLRGSDVFVLPSRSEGFSNAILEAMAASLPVVATDVGGNAEAVEDGVNGFIVPSEDVAAMAAAMERLLGDGALAERMGAEGRRLATERFTLGAMMERITGVYGDLLGDRQVMTAVVTREAV